MKMTGPAELRLAELLEKHRVLYGEERQIVAHLEYLARRRLDDRIRLTDVERAFFDRTCGLLKSAVVSAESAR